MMISEYEEHLEEVPGFDNLDVYKREEGPARSYRLEHEGYELDVVPRACEKVAEMLERLNEGDHFYNALCKTYSNNSARKRNREKFDPLMDEGELKEGLEEDFEKLQEIMEEGYTYNPEDSL